MPPEDMAAAAAQTGESRERGITGRTDATTDMTPPLIDGAMGRAQVSEVTVSEQDDDLPDPDLWQPESDDDDDADAEAARFLLIRERERKARRPWRDGSLPTPNVSDHPTTLTLGLSRLPDSAGPTHTSITFAECTFPPHGGEIVATGSIAWDSSLVLAQYLATNEVTALVKGARVIELGAGIAIPSLACAALGAATVYATDVEARLALIRSNIRLNATLAGLCGEVLPWGDEGAAASVGGRTFDVVLCSDVLFSDEAIEPLVKSIDAVTAPTGTVFSCCEHRFAGALAFYTALRNRGFTVSRVPLEEQHPLYHHESIHLFRAVRRVT
jgi:SAM-dependent methyltransferase